MNLQEKENIIHDNANVDIYSVIEILLQNKISILVSVLAGLIIGYILYNDDSENIVYEFTFKVNNVSILPASDISISDTENVYFNENLMNASTIDYFIDNLLSRQNILSALEKSRKSEDYDVYENVDNYKNILENLTIEKTTRLNDYTVSRLNDYTFNFLSTQFIEDNFDVALFIQNLILDAEIKTKKNIIDLYEKNILDLKNLIDNEKKYLKITQDRNNGLDNIELERSLNVIDRKYKLDLILLEQNRNIATNLGYEEPAISLELDLILNTSADLENVNEEIYEGINIKIGSNIITLSKSTGIPLYMFGYKLLNVEIEALKKDKYKTIKDAKINSLQSKKEFEATLNKFDFNAEVLYLIDVLKKTSTNFKNNDNNLFDKDISLNFLSTQKVLVNQNSFLKIILTSIIFFVISVFIILYRKESYRRSTINIQVK